MARHAAGMQAPRCRVLVRYLDLHNTYNTAELPHAPRQIELKMLHRVIRLMHAYGRSVKLLVRGKDPPAG